MALVTHDLFEECRVAVRGDVVGGGCRGGREGDLGGRAAGAGAEELGVDVDAFAVDGGRGRAAWVPGIEVPADAEEVAFGHFDGGGLVGGGVGDFLGNGCRDAALEAGDVPVF